MKYFRDFCRGDLLTIHLSDNTTVAGVFERITRKNVHLTRGEMEAGQAMRVLTSEKLVVPRDNVKAYEVRKP